jgi:quinol monooxygenase YgiN
MESAFKTAVAQIVLPTRAEEGCVSFTFNQSVQDPTEFSVVGVWRSRADADKHGETPHMKKCLDTVGKMFAPGYPILKSYENLDETFEEETPIGDTSRKGNLCTLVRREIDKE